jgi:hypothetical protein
MMAKATCDQSGISPERNILTVIRSYSVQSKKSIWNSVGRKWNVSKWRERKNKSKQTRKIIMTAKLELTTMMECNMITAEKRRRLMLRWWGESVYKEGMMEAMSYYLTSIGTF